ncbi:hypothetical protein AAF712_003973 [Marasmius tenuissimus]|uniref:Protein kinase domain-containing protein n=1 Tax=Marasmius tenuissimus TaxID=585030 RepID=A0ABR3A618_9AGAR
MNYKFELYAFHIPADPPNQIIPLQKHYVEASLDKTINDLAEDAAGVPRASPSSRSKGLTWRSCILRERSSPAYHDVHSKLKDKPEHALEDLAEDSGSLSRKRQRTASTDEEDLMPLMKNFKQYTNHVLTWKTPSAAAKSSAYEDNQSARFARLDGRFAGDKGVETTAPPIELYHPTFAQFVALAQAQVDDPKDGDILRDAAALIRSCSQIEMQEGPRNTKTRELLQRILRIPFERVINDDQSAANYIALHATPLDSVAASSAILEVKAELGSTGTDPSVQASFSFGRFYCQPQRNAITEHSNCPTFIVGIAGPWLVVMGAVLTTRVVAQRLSDFMWLGCSRTMDEAQVKRVASTLYALRRAIQTLNQLWNSFKKPKIVEGCEHPRFFPYWDSFTDEHREVVNFVYVKPLEDWPSCVTFLAKRLPGNGGSDDKDSRFVIKFVRRYERDAHAVMGKEGFAPKLLGFRQLREEDSGYKDLVLVAMEYVEGKALCDLYNDNALPAEVKQGVQDALQALNGAGYIFADLRRPNVMVRASDEKVQLIDFDWVCKMDGGMRYPFHLSPDIKCRSKAKDYDVITLDHQNRMFEVL